jgi:hypothetical protein
MGFGRFNGSSLRWRRSATTRSCDHGRLRFDCRRACVALALLVYACRVAGHAASWSSRPCRRELDFCNRPAIRGFIVDGVRGARVTRWCPMNGGERVDDRGMG